MRVRLHKSRRRSHCPGIQSSSLLQDALCLVDLNVWVVRLGWMVSSQLSRVGCDPVLLFLYHPPPHLTPTSAIPPPPHVLCTPRSPSSLAPCPGQEPAQVSLDRAINKIDHPPEPRLALAGPARSRRPASGAVSLIRERRHLFFILTPRCLELWSADEWRRATSAKESWAGR